jgi:hydrogenase nickel incorporation protein HypA/HybF
MHEYSLVQALLERVEEEARARNASAVHRIWVRIGALSGVEPELLASAYDICRGETLCRVAELTIRKVQVRWACPQCDATIPQGAALRCVACDQPARLDSGDEILLERIEMEVA